MATSAASKYDELCLEHEWDVPERYNIVQDVCDKHPRDKPAMIWERYDGATRELTWGEMQDLSNQAAHWLVRRGGGGGARAGPGLPAAPGSRSCCRRRPRRRPGSSRPGRSARSSCPCRCSTATTASATA